MTLMEFSRKYKIPHRIAYEAAYKVQPTESLCAYVEYPERELAEAVVDLLIMRRGKHQRLIDRYNEYIASAQHRNYAAKGGEQNEDHAGFRHTAGSDQNVPAGE